MSDSNRMDESGGDALRLPEVTDLVAILHVIHKHLLSESSVPVITELKQVLQKATAVDAPGERRLEMILDVLQQRLRAEQGHNAQWVPTIACLSIPDSVALDSCRAELTLLGLTDFDLTRDSVHRRWQLSVALPAESPDPDGLPWALRLQEVAVCNSSVCELY